MTLSQPWEGGTKSPKNASWNNLNILEHKIKTIQKLFSFFLWEGKCECLRGGRIWAIPKRSVIFLCEVISCRWTRDRGGYLHLYLSEATLYQGWTVQLRSINPQNIRCQPYDTAKSRSKYGNWLKYVHLKLDGQMVPSSPMFTLLVPENFQL